MTVSQLIATSENTIVVGMGATGVSVVRFLRRQNRPVQIVDTREKPPGLNEFRQEFPEVGVSLGQLSGEMLCKASRIVVSPGVSLQEPAIQQAQQAGVKITGDIQLFVEYTKAPVVAITGSNAKTTVTTLVGKMLEDADWNVAVAGNIGTPVLDLLNQPVEHQCYVLELSSFQLETIDLLSAEVACILNVTPDHMDRYDSLTEYHAAKQRIYYGAEKIVINRDDPLTQPPLRPGLKVNSFGLGKPDLKQFGVLEEDAKQYLAQGLEKLMAVSELKMFGSHNIANALAALAIGNHMQLPMASMLNTLRQFNGLPHRCEQVATINGIDFINDSKGTNVGATLAALNGLSRLPSKLILIAGGDGKGADFEPLGPVLRDQLRHLVVIGLDGWRVAAIADAQGVSWESADNMQEAVEKAAAKALGGDAVLLSPACASLDMFNNYQERGENFIKAVQELAS